MADVRALEAANATIQDTMGKRTVGTFFSRLTRRKNDAVRHAILPDILQTELHQEGPVTRSQVAKLLKERHREGVEVPDSITIHFK